MRYRVEYLTEAAEDEGVCNTLEADCDLVTAEWFARAHGAEARKKFRAEGFQIRDLHDRGRIVALESFDNPLRRFHAGDYVIH